jgi:acetolactate synthase-1/2/3 large subunit
MNVADCVARTLREYGADYFFLVTGGDHDLWFAIKDAGIRFVNARSEKAAVYMADGYARVRYRPGFVYGQFGPGAANVAAGLADPFWASSPVVAITTSMSTVGRYKSEYQELDQQKLFDAVTKWNGLVPTARRAAELLRYAIRNALSSCPGPTHLDIPNDLLGIEIERPEIYADFKEYPAFRCAPDDSSISQAADILLKAERPVIVAGAGVLLSRAWEELLSVAELLSIPVATSVGGKGCFPENHPLAIGVVGKYSRKSANELLLQSDVALYVGCKLGGLATNAFKIPSLNTRIIHMDIAPEMMGRNYRVEVPLVADAKLGLSCLLTAIHKRCASRTEIPWALKARDVTNEWKKEFEAVASASTSPIKPQRIIKVLRDLLDKDDIVVADTGNMCAWTGACYEIRSQGRNFIRAAGSLGWAFPASIGAKLAAMEKNVVCVTGDGGIAYHISELETALRLKIPVVTLVLNNRSLNFEYHDQKYLHGKVVPEVNDFIDVDYGRVASAFGAHGLRIEKAQELNDAIREAMETDNPSLIDIIVDREEVSPTTYYEHITHRKL